VTCYIWSIALCGAKTWTLRKIDEKYLGSFEISCWRRMDKVRWTDHVKNKNVLHGVKEERKIRHTIRRRKDTWICHTLRRNCLLEHVIEGKIETTGRIGRRDKQLLDDPEENSILEFERGSTRSHSVENLLGKKLWPCDKTDYVKMTVKVAISGTSGTKDLLDIAIFWISKHYT
jgi:hypothetical protein